MAKVILEVEKDQPLRIELENVESPEQVLWMLARAQIIILTEEPDGSEEDVQELSTADGEEEEANVSDVPE